MLNSDEFIAGPQGDTLQCSMECERSVTFVRLFKSVAIVKKQLFCVVGACIRLVVRTARGEYTLRSLSRACDLAAVVMTAVCLVSHALARLAVFVVCFLHVREVP